MPVTARPSAQSVPPAGGVKTAASKAATSKSTSAPLKPTPASAVSKAKSAPAAPKAKSAPAAPRSKPAQAAPKSKAGTKANPKAALLESSPSLPSPTAAAGRSGIQAEEDDLGEASDDDDDADLSEEDREPARKKAKGAADGSGKQARVVTPTRRSTRLKTGKTKQPEQVTTEEDSEGDEDRHPKQARKNAKQPKSTSKPSGKQITFKEHSDSMILKVERWMNGEGVLDGVPASEAQTWMSAMVVGQGSRTIQQEDSRAVQRAKSIQARLLLSKTQLVNALALFIDDTSPQAQQLRQRIDALEEELDIALDGVFTSDEDEVESEGGEGAEGYEGGEGGEGDEADDADS